MATQIITALNQPCLIDVPAAESLQLQFAGIQLDTKDSDVVVYGIDFSIFLFNVADYAVLIGASFILQRNLVLDPGNHGGAQGVPSNLIFYRSFNSSNRDYARSIDFKNPIRLAGGVPYACWGYAIYIGVPAAGLTRVAINLRAEVSSRTSFPYQLR